MERETKRSFVNWLCDSVPRSATMVFGAAVALFAVSGCSGYGDGGGGGSSSGNGSGGDAYSSTADGGGGGSEGNGDGSANGGDNGGSTDDAGASGGDGGGSGGSDGGGSGTSNRQWYGKQKELDWVADDIETVDQDEQENVRYLSLVNRHNQNDLSEKDLNRLRNSISMVVNSLQNVNDNGGVVHPKPVPNSKKTIYRINIEDYGWDAETWQDIVQNYPYGVDYQDNQENVLYNIDGGTQEEIQEDTQTEIPIVHAEWFIEETLKSPLYYDIIGLGANGNEAAINDALGIDIQDNIDNRDISRAGLFKDADPGIPSDDHRVVERHDLNAQGALWITYDFLNAQDDRNIRNNVFDFDEDGREYIFNLPNGLQAYAISDGDGIFVNQVGDTEVVSDPNRDNRQVLNAASCTNCHKKQGILITKNKQDDLYEFAQGELNGDELNDFLDAYKEPSRILDLQKQDQDYFKNARQNAKLEAYKNAPVSMYTSVVNYEKGVGHARIAHNLGITLDKVDTRFDAARNSGDLPGEVDGIVENDNRIDRVTYEQVENEVVCAIGLGDPLEAGDDPGVFEEDTAIDCGQVLNQ